MSAFRFPSGAFTSTDQEVAEHLLETHFPGCQPISGPQSQSQPITSSTEDWLIASSVITEEKIRWAINGFGSYKTAGEDGIFPGLLQQGIETLVVPLCKILTACLSLLHSGTTNVSILCCNVSVLTSCYIGTKSAHFIFFSVITDDAISQSSVDRVIG
jgi:hypothetical protein